MASIENKSRIQVSVKGHPGLTQLFPHDKGEKASAYVRELSEAGHAPQLASLDDAYLVRFSVNGERKSLTATSEKEAVAIKKQLEVDKYRGFFVDYTKARQTTFADLLIRYLEEEAPKTKGFLITGYQVNSWLEDAGLQRQDIAKIHAAHKLPHDRELRIPAPTGRRMRTPSNTAGFIRKPFASLVPQDFHDFYEERRQVVGPATVDREHDLLKAVCTHAIKSWRIAVAQHPMDGVKMPSYYNERDRRVSPEEELRLMAAAEQEDRRAAIAARVEELLSFEPARDEGTKYARRQVLDRVRAAAETSYVHVPLMATFIQFQLMAGPRRSETLNLHWTQVDLEGMTAFLPETKNGRSRSLVLRSALINLLRELPRTDELVFPMSTDQLRKAWDRICTTAGISTDGDDALHVHDLRHEAISRVAEAGSNTPGGFTLLDLQLFSGHRDPRMLMRYANLLPKGLAQRLDKAFEKKGLSIAHQGRKRLTKKALAILEDLLQTAEADEEPGKDEDVAQSARVQPTQPVSPGCNVIAVDFGWAPSSHLASGQ